VLEREADLRQMSAWSSKLCCIHPQICIIQSVEKQQPLMGCD